MYQITFHYNVRAHVPETMKIYVFKIQRIWSHKAYEHTIGTDWMKTNAMDLCMHSQICIIEQKIISFTNCFAHCSNNGNCFMADGVNSKLVKIRASPRFPFHRRTCSWVNHPSWSILTYLFYYILKLDDIAFLSQGLGTNVHLHCCLSKYFLVVLYRAYLLVTSASLT